MGCGASSKEEADKQAPPVAPDSSEAVKKDGEAAPVAAEPVAAEKLKDDAQDAIVDAADQRKKKVKVHIGPLEVGTDGAVLKPKFNIGITGADIYMLAGVRDVRDGLAVEAYGQMQKAYSTEGSSLVEALSNVKAEDPVPGLDKLIEAIPDALAATLEELKVDLSLEGAEIKGVVYVYVGLGVTAGVYLGWVDTKGYHMVGMEGKVAVAVDSGLALRVGLHEDRGSVRLVMYFANVGFDAVIKLKTPAGDSRAGAAAPAAEGPAAEAAVESAPAATAEAEATPATESAAAEAAVELAPAATAETEGTPATESAAAEAPAENPGEAVPAEAAAEGAAEAPAAEAEAPAAEAVA